MNSDKNFPNFLESLFQRNIHAEAILPFPTLDEDDQEFADMMLTTQSKFIAENINAEAIDQAATIDPALISAYADLGFFAMTIPEEFEGAEAPYTTYCRLYEDLCRGDASFSTVLGGHQSLAMKPVLLSASKEQKERWLPKLASGEYIGAFALTEPSAGSDVHNLKSIAQPSEDGTHYIVNGEKL
ncbi:MAG: acyl-CoA dehydrogenase family protein, partial [Planctomycetes bacterium]|nr:acyl-CoA dehydrogenase family protein [Planctomycetota bacterium]